MNMDKIGEWAFVIGVVLAILLGIFDIGAMLGTIQVVLVVLGILVGLINVTSRETTKYLVAAIALLVAGTAGFGTLPMIGAIVARIVANIGFFVAPAAVVVALRSVMKTGKD